MLKKNFCRSERTLSLNANSKKNCLVIWVRLKGNDNSTKWFVFDASVGLRLRLVKFFRVPGWVAESSKASVQTGFEVKRSWRLLATHYRPPEGLESAVRVSLKTFYSRLQIVLSFREAFSSKSVSFCILLYNSIRGGQYCKSTMASSLLWHCLLSTINRELSPVSSSTCIRCF